MKLIKKLNLRVCFASLRLLYDFNLLITMWSWYYDWISQFMQLTALHLVDAHLCSDPGKYVGALLLSLSTVLHLELPRINVLSKIDLIESYGKARFGSFPFFPVLRIMLSWRNILSTYHKCLSMCAAFNLDFYTGAQYLSYLQHHLDQDPRAAKHWSLFIESIPEFFKPIFVLYSMHGMLNAWVLPLSILPFCSFIHVQHCGK